MKMEFLRLKEIITWRHTCSSTNIKKPFKKTKDPRFMKDILTGELYDTYIEEYRDSMFDKSCLDCKCSGSLAVFYDPLYRTVYFQIAINKEYTLPFTSRYVVECTA